MIFKKYRMTLGLISVLLLSGCANIHAPQASRYFQVQSAAQRQTSLAKINAWRMEGVFSITQQGENPLIADYSWQQFGRKNYRINISSDLGLYSLAIHRQLGVVKLWKNGTQVFTAKTPEKLMQKAVGWSLPIRPLQSWMKGMPAKNAGHFEARYDYFGHLIFLQQAGWTLQLSAYKNNDDHVDFPQVILMQRPGLSVKIVVSDWLLYLRHHPLPDAIM